MQEYSRFILDNGLTVVLVPNLHTSMVCVSMLYKVGSRNEHPEKTGMAHLFEHLMFSNCGRDVDFDGLMQSAGGDSNAFTTQDTTQYYNVAPASQLELMLQLEARRLDSFKILKKDFKVQQRVVVEEFGEHYLNNPYGLFSHLLMPMAYKIHPYQWPVIGKSQEQISMLNLEDANFFFEQYYSPSNSILVVCGAMIPEHCLQLIHKYFNFIPSRATEMHELPQEPEQMEKRSLWVPGQYPEEAIYIAFHSNKRMSKDFYSMDFATDILAEGKSSILYKELKKEQMLFSSVDCYMTSTYDPGLIIFEGKLNKGVSIEDGQAAFFKIIEQLKQKPISPYIFEKYMNKNESAYLSSQVGIISQTLNFSYSESLGDVNLVNTELDHYKSVTLDDIQGAFLKYFNTDHASYLYFQNK